MSRTTAVLLAMLLPVLRVSAADSIALTDWIIYKKDLAPPYTTAINGPDLNLAPSGKVDSAYFSKFKPLPLGTGRSITFSARLLLPDQFPKSSGGQIRIGLYGVTAGTNPDTEMQSDLRGFVVMGGGNGNGWMLELHEHASPTGSLIHLNGLTKHGITSQPIEIPRGVETRVVMTVTKKSPDLITIGGFWSDMPFSFETKPLAGDYTHLRAVVLMRGNASGTNNLKFSNVKIRSD